MTAESVGYRELIDRLVAWAFLYHGAEVLQDVIEVGIDRLLVEMGMEKSVSQIDLLDLTPDATSRLQVGSLIADAINKLDSRRREIALRRTFSADPETLADIGRSFGISRERVRQLEVDVVEIFEKNTGDSLLRACVGLKRAMGAVAQRKSVLDAIERLTLDAPPSMHKLCMRLLRERSGYAFTGQLAVAGDYDGLVEEVKNHARAIADERGIVDEDALWETIQIRDVDLQDQVIADAGLHRIFGFVALRDTQRAKAILALRHIGRPATKEEISEVAKMPIRNLASLFSREEDVVRVTKNAWGFREWTDDPYDGVFGEIIQRINEDGGATEVDRLLEDIPNRFNVSRHTVQAYLATDKFNVRDGSVSIAEEIEVQLEPLSTLQEIVWDPEGRPVLQFVVEEKYLRGHSMNIPAEVASYLGVDPDGRRTVPFKHPEVGSPASIIWRAHDPSGPEIGQFRDALEAIAAPPNQELFLVLDSDGLELRRDGSGLIASPPEHHKTDSSDSPDSGELSLDLESEAIQKMKNRRKIWPSDL